MNRFPYEIVNWDVSTNSGIMYPTPTGWATLLALVICLAVLYVGQKWEDKCYKNAEE